MSIKNLVLRISCLPVKFMLFQGALLWVCRCLSYSFLLVYMCVCVCYSVNSTHILLSCLQTYAYVKI